MVLKRYGHILFFLLILCILGCSKCGKEEPAKEVLVEKPEMVNEEIWKLLSEKLSTADTSQKLVLANDSLDATKLITEFYKLKKYIPAWTDKGDLNKQGDTLLNILKNADVYGLIPSDYHFFKIDSLLNTCKDSATKRFNAVKLYEADVLLTDAFFTFAVHVSKGRFNADSLTLEWHPEKLDTNLVALLDTCISRNIIHETMDSLEPRNSQYQKLKLALKEFKFQFKDADWDSLANRESDSLTFRERVKGRLVCSQDYFDEFKGNDSIKLVKSIKNFQCRHNLTEDGKVGKLTFRALQRTKQDYIHQIELNMERWRWKKEPKDKQLVWVNIPKFEMRVIEKDTLVMKSRVIVGEPDHQTPVLKSTIRYFIIYPYWTVPYSIATKEILPILKRDTSYLRRKNFDVLDGNNYIVDPSTINWKRYSKTYFPWKLRQRIGEDNSLGVLKFNFENKYGVYMHDTDNRKLFNREMRAMSHGCCRLDKWMDFAKFLIRDDSVKYPVDSLEADLEKEKQKYVYFRRAIPLYINYYTAEVDEHGGLFLFLDVYRKDEKMLDELYRRKRAGSKN